MAKLRGTAGKGVRAWKWLGIGAGLLATVGAAPAEAAGFSVKFLRIDPEPTMDGKQATVATLVELGTPVPVSDMELGCQTGGGNAGLSQHFSCISGKIEAQGYEIQAEPFPKDAQLYAVVSGEETPLDIDQTVKFSEAADIKPNTGVAWLIILDASSSIGANRLAEEQDAAEQIVKAMGKNDAVRVDIIDDQGARAQTGWLARDAAGKAITAIRSVKGVFATARKVDALIGLIEKQAVGGFQALLKDGVDGSDEGTWPLMQAIVVLSDGGDTSVAGYAGQQTAQALHDRLAKGSDFSEFTRLPIPVITLWFPNEKLTGGWLNVENEQKTNNAYQWMSNLATPEVGGYFDIIQAGETGKAAKIAKIIRNRFNNLYYVTAKATCLDASGDQTFTLAFSEHKNITPDKWSKVTIAFRPDEWPLAVDKKKTESIAAQKPLLPGENFSVFGDFCWNDKSQAEAYFLTDADAPEVKKAVADKSGKKLKALAQNLSAKGQKAEVVSATATEAVFKAPTTAALFDNKGDAFTLNLVVFDNRAKRVSTLDKKGVLVMKGGKPPLNKMIIVGAIGAGVVLILLIAILARGGGGGGSRARRRGGPGRPPGP